MFLRAAIRGLITGSLLTSLALLVFPHFYGRWFEPYALPLAGAVVGLGAGLIVLLWRKIRRRAVQVSDTALLSGWLRVVLGLAVLLPGLLYVVRTPARHWRVAPELAVLCIDGGTWDLIDPLVETGRMPNLAQLQREGVSGVLMSTDPSFSPVVWTTIGAGVKPEKHGITSFYATQDYLRSKRFWDVFEEAGRSIGMFRWLVTWPPHVTNGFIIPDILAQDAQCFPPKYDFVNQLRIDAKGGRSTSVFSKAAVAWKFLRAGLRMETCLAVAREVVPALRSGRYADFHIAARRIEIRLNADVYCHLLREAEPEFTCFYDNGADVLCHYYWEFFQPDLFVDVEPGDAQRYGGAIADYYELNDAVFGRIIDHLDPSTSIVILSDHGHAADPEGAKRNFYLRGEPVLDALGMSGDYYSIALASQTFVESIKTDPAERRAALERAVALLNAVTLEEDGIKVLDAKIYQDERVIVTASEDLTALDGSVRTDAGVHPVEEWFTTKAMSGIHEPEGIYLFKGPAFRAGVKGPEAELIDVAPTILFLSGFPLSREIDGEVVWGAFSQAFRADNDVAWVDTYGHFDSLRRDLELDAETVKKLRALGYIR
jgi:hypothetical protein